jgi:hypothetical protein
MAHQWELIDGNELPLTLKPRRRCEKCKKTQVREANHLWMRVTGYQWTPKVGRCPADKRKTK